MDMNNRKAASAAFFNFKKLSLVSKCIKCLNISVNLKQIMKAITHPEWETTNGNHINSVG